MLKREIVIIMLCPWALAFADSWDLIQSVAIHSNVSISQANGSSNIQGVNVIHLNGGYDSEYTLILVTKC